MMLRQMGFVASFDIPDASRLKLHEYGYLVARLAVSSYYRYFKPVARETLIILNVPSSLSSP